MAASLPLALIMMDYFNKRISLKSWVEKIPYFLLALVFGIIAIYAQKSTNSILQPSDISFPQRILFASFSFINYLYKLLIPFQYCAFYPYPIEGGKVFIPGFYYIFPVLVIVLLTLVFYTLRFSRKILFSLGFFTVTILLVLQLLPVGKAIMADRYGYIPSIGIFYLIGEGWLYLYNTKFRQLAYILMAGMILFLPFKTYSRCRVWVNDFVFWSDVIDQYQTVEDAYYNRGIIYMNENRNELALQDFDQALEIKPDFSNAFNNKGLLLMNIGKSQESLQNFDKAIESNPSNPDAYYNRGTLFHRLSKNPEALADFNKAVELNPDYSAAYNNRGSVFFKEKRNAEAVQDFIKALELNPENAEAYYNYGVLLMEEKNLTKAVQQFNKAIELNPYYANAFNNRAIVYAEEKKFSESLNDFTTLISLQPDNYTAFNNRGMIYMNLKKNAEAFNDFNQAIQLNPRFAGAYNNLANLLFDEKNYPEAIRLYSSVIALLNNYPQAWYKRGLAEYNLGNKSAALTDLRQSASMGYKPAAEALSGIH
jgi:tetratricopeptide (TPR) repeat protein